MKLFLTIFFSFVFSFGFSQVPVDQVLQFENGCQLREISAPSTPGSGYGHVYEKSDGHIYFLNDAGTEYDLTLQGTVTGVTVTDGSGFNLTVTGTTAPDISLTTSLNTGSAVFIGSSGALSEDNTNYFFDDSGNQLKVLNYQMPATTSSTAGVFTIGSNRFLHTYKPAGSNDNLFLGRDAGNFTLSATSNFNANIGIGQNALDALTTGYFNTVVGVLAGDFLTTGNNNSLYGLQAGKNLGSGNNNTVVGSSALFGGGASISSTGNTSIGVNSLNLIQSGADNNVALGLEAGENNSTGDNNIFLGTRAGEGHTTGSNNIVIGYDIEAPSGTASNQINIGGVWGGNTSTGIPSLIGSLATDNTNTQVTAVDPVSKELELVDISSITGAFTDDQNLTYNASTHTVEINDGTDAVIPLADDDGATEGLASFTAADFTADADGNIVIDYANGQAATSGQDGFLQSADWTTFNNKLSAEVDGSTSNELQNLSWDAVNNEVDISLGGTSAAIPMASTTDEGLVSLTTQTFEGNKTFDDDVTVTDNLTVDGGTLAVDATNNTVDIGGTNTENYNVHVQENARVEVVLSGYTANKTILAIRRANGTLGSETPILNTEIIGDLSWGGYKSTAWSTSSVAAFQAVATEDFDDSGTGTKLVGQVTPNNTTGVIDALVLQQDGTTSAVLGLTAGNATAASAEFQVGTDGDLDKIKNISYSWPADDGDASEVLTTDGSGNLTWEPAGGGSQTPWTSNINADGFTLFGNDGSGESLTLTSTSHATKGFTYLGASGVFALDETNERVGINEATPDAKLHLVTDGIGVTQSNANGIYLQNTTAASSGNQQMSPPVVWEGQGWKTNATAASQSAAFKADVLPVQGSSAPTAQWNLAASINGAAYSNAATIVFASGAGQLVMSHGTFSGMLSTSSQLRVTGTSSTQSLTYRLTNGGSNVTPQACFNTGFGSATAGQIGYGFGDADGFIIVAANGTRQIARAGIGITNLDNTAGSEDGDLIFLTQAGGTAMTEKVRISNTGNLGIGATSFGTSAAGVLAIKNGTIPGSSPADMVQLYAEDVSSSSELKVRDEGGTVTTLSPHNFTYIPGGKSEEMAWSFYSEHGDVAVNVDMMKVVRALEELTGEQYIYLIDKNTGKEITSKKQLRKLYKKN